MLLFNAMLYIFICVIYVEMRYSLDYHYISHGLQILNNQYSRFQDEGSGSEERTKERKTTKKSATTLIPEQLVRCVKHK